MTTREKFEKWAETEGYKVDWLGDHYKYSLTQVAWGYWRIRQPEIDALKAENEKLRKDAERLLSEINLYSERDMDAGWKGVWEAVFALSDTLNAAMTAPDTEVRDDQP